MNAPALVRGSALTFVLSLAVAVAAAGQAGAPLRQREELTRLDAYLAAGDVARAEALLQAVASDLAKDDRFAFDTIYVLIARGRFPEAKAQWNRLAGRLQESLRPAPDTSPSSAGGEQRQRRLAEALFTQGLLTARGGEKAEALRLLQQADGYGFPPLESPLMRLAADCLRDLQEYDLAVSAYREFLKRKPSDAGARLDLATSLYSSGKLASAQKEVEDLLRAAPKTPRAHYTLGAVLFAQSRHDEARVSLERELTLDPRCTPCLSRLAHIAYLDGDDPRCESWLAKAAALDQDGVETRLVSGMLALRNGRYEAAIIHLSRVVELSPDFAAARFQLAMAYRRVGNAEKASEHLEVYQRLLKEQKARELGVRGSG